MKIVEKTPEKLLESFMKEFFPYQQFKKIGIFTKEMKGDYKAQAEKICSFLGYKSIYEYRARKSARFHISYAGKIPEGAKFVEELPSIYE